MHHMKCSEVRAYHAPQNLFSCVPQCTPKYVIRYFFTSNSRHLQQACRSLSASPPTTANLLPRNPDHDRHHPSQDNTTIPKTIPQTIRVLRLPQLPSLLYFTIRRSRKIFNVTTIPFHPIIHPPSNSQRQVNIPKPD